MTCRSHQDALLDLARGVPQPAATAQAAEQHLAECEPCRLELRRQRGLTASLDALTREAQGWRPAPGAEARFLAAVNRERHDAQTEVASSQRRGSVARHAKWIAAAAAAVAVTAWLGLRGERPVEPPPAAAAAAPFAPAPLPAPLPSSSPAVASGSGAGNGAAAAGRPSPGREPHGRTPGPRSLEFIQTPAAAALPPIESGSIVRLALAISELPAYGVAIAPDSAGSSVEADVLVGQDGQIRGIRLVSPGAASAGSGRP